MLTDEQKKAAHRLAVLGWRERDLSEYPLEVQKEMLDYIDYIEVQTNQAVDELIMERIFCR